MSDNNVDFPWAAFGFVVMLILCIILVMAVFVIQNNSSKIDIQQQPQQPQQVIVPQPTVPVLISPPHRPHYGPHRSIIIAPPHGPPPHRSGPGFSLDIKTNPADVKIGIKK